MRGGVAKGEWFRQGDIIISDALVKAYLMESRKAKYPILAIDPDTYKYFASLPGRRNYSPDTDPIKGLFKSTKNGQDTAYYLDYLNIGFACSDYWYCEKDRKKYLAAKTDERKNEIFCKSHKKNQLAFLKAHQRTIIDALKKSTDKRTKSKYRWLCRYHNSIVRGKGPDFKSALIDSAIIMSSKT